MARRMLFGMYRSARVERHLAAVQFHRARAAEANQRRDDTRSLLLLRLGLAGGEIKALRMCLGMLHRYPRHLPVQFHTKIRQNCPLQMMLLDCVSRGRFSARA
jgi:hypothetical protein